MGFYDERIKYLYETCPRLVIISINSIFGKNHAETAEVTYLNRELQGDETEHAKYMDMLLQIEDCKYHLEFQLERDCMAIRMYEYAVKDTIREVHALVDGKTVSDFELDIKMPQQAVIFLSGANNHKEISVRLMLPDGNVTRYKIPCVSAADSVEVLIQKNQFLLVPFQQVQLGKKIRRLRDERDATVKSAEDVERLKEERHNAAQEILEYRNQVKIGLEKLVADAIITNEEKNVLFDVMWHIEVYMTYGATQISEEVNEVGDEDYILISDVVKAEGKAERTTEIISTLLSDGHSVEEVASLLHLAIEEVQAVQQS